MADYDFVCCMMQLYKFYKPQNAFQNVKFLCLYSTEQIFHFCMTYITRNTSLKHTSKNAKKKLRIHQVFSFILQPEKYIYNL